MAHYNQQEMHVAPHSASAYNAMWLPARGGVNVEVGQHPTWACKGLAPLLSQQFHVINEGFELLPFDPAFDNHPSDGERSFNAGPEMMQAIFNATKGSLCRRQQ